MSEHRLHYIVGGTQCQQSCNKVFSRTRTVSCLRQLRAEEEISALLHNGRFTAAMMLFDVSCKVLCRYWPFIMQLEKLTKKNPNNNHVWFEDLVLQLWVPSDLPFCLRQSRYIYCWYFQNSTSLFSGDLNPLIHSTTSFPSRSAPREVWDWDWPQMTWRAFASHCLFMSFPDHLMCYLAGEWTGHALHFNSN